ncbi:acyltransferase family protein [Microbacterium rhizomatis]|uniref:Acyltransferase n=1 Tax=Microbacterium rhizomatis TaxID=1631477 RepID=A0A5J5J884_9MICO|nr:acyltransferase [Microbacterium rhizomatis]KAA9111225.1 acyltransferase [Microbacterium rhizomatis]
MKRFARLRGAPYPYRANSLNMFRLILAGLVLFAHSWYVAGQGSGPSIQGENLGGWAVAGFFVLSGFLITRSRLRTSPGDYLLHRVARIYPAFIVVLLVTAFIFAPVALLIQQGSLSGFLSTPITPLQYVWGNLALYIEHYDIGATLQTVPYPGAWNGSLWTLFYEFLCYVVIWVLGFIGLARRSPILVGALWVVSVATYAGIGAAQRAGLDVSFELFARLLPFFLGGSLIFYIVDRFGINRILGIVSLIVTVALIWTVPRWGGQLAAPFLAYGLLSLSTWIPQPRWVARNDVSYGFYIYAWPMQQLVVLIGGAALGMPVYILITIVVTFAFAWLSWVLIERPAMRIARPPREPAPAAPAEQPGDIQVG